MSNIARMMQRATAGAGGAGLDVDEVFSTFLYEGNGGTQSIVNNIDLTEGGLVWIKNRDDAENHGLVDTAVNGLLFSNLTNAANTGITHTFNTNGFTVGSSGSMNDSNDSHVSWTFRKAPKFFDVVVANSISGSGNTISHSLGCDVGMIIAKKKNGTDNWYVWHKGINTGSMYLNGNNATGSITTEYVFGNGSSVVQPTSTQFTFGAPTSGDYVFYLFAHNNNDGGFGPDGDQDIIKCGSYVGNESSFPTIDLGFEPQWVMIKAATRTSNWQIFDSMRGIPTGGNENYLWANTSDSEGSSNDYIDLNPTGFGPSSVEPHTNSTGETFIYMAIRRGSLFPPDDATKVFNVSGSANSNVISTGFNVDMNINTTTNSQNNHIITRLMGNKSLKTNETESESDRSGVKWFNYLSNHINLNDSWWSTNSALISWSWKRAPSYFDVCCYSGTGSAGLAVNHNLGVVPEMMWVKSRSHGGTFYDWAVYHKDLGNTKYLFLNTNAAAGTNNEYWNNTSPTSSVFSLGGTSTRTNESGKTYIAYLFATVAGVSKVGSFSHTYGSTTNVDCGFSSGARFVLWKRYDGSRHWEVFDTVRGLVSGNDSYLRLSDTSAASTSYDFIDPLSSGFQVGGTLGSGNFIFYAIA